MRIKCIKTNLGEKKPEIMNSWLDGHINVNDEFEVLGIRFDRGQGVTYLMYFDGRHLVQAPKDLFEIIDPTIYSFMKAKDEGDNFYLWPDLFFRPWFFDEFSEDNPEEKTLFKNFIEEYNIR